MNTDPAELAQSLVFFANRMDARERRQSPEHPEGSMLPETECMRQAATLLEQMASQQMAADLTFGIHITQGGRRIAPEDFYANTMTAEEVLVPREPTPEMIEAGNDSPIYMGDYDFDAADVWRRMIAAMPVTK